MSKSITIRTSTSSWSSDTTSLRVRLRSPTMTTSRYPRESSWESLNDRIRTTSYCSSRERSSKLTRTLNWLWFNSSRRMMTCLWSKELSGCHTRDLDPSQAKEDPVEDQVLKTLTQIALLFRGPSMRLTSREWIQSKTPHSTKEVW